jgi:hypothetical protein
LKKRRALIGCLLGPQATGEKGFKGIVSWLLKEVSSSPDLFVYSAVVGYSAQVGLVKGELN